jgi:hypothetical protein
VQIAESHGEADLARARKQAEQVVVVSEGDLGRSRRQAEQTVVLAEADARQRELAGRGEAQKIAHVGLSEAAVLFQRIASYRDPRLYAMSLLAEQLSKSTQPLVPERVFVAGAAGGDGAQTAPVGQATGLLGLLVSLLVAEKSGFQTESSDPALSEFKAFADRMTKQVIESVESGPAEQK